MYIDVFSNQVQKEKVYVFLARKESRNGGNIMIDAIFDTAYPAGRFDTSLNLIEGNPYMYRFFGSNVYFSIQKIVNADEQKKLAEDIEQCRQNPQLRIDECIHISNSKGGQDCYFLGMKLSDTPDILNITLINVTESKAHINSLNRRLMLARNYLTLNGTAVFVYKPSTNFIEISYVKNEQTAVFYNMDIDEWKAQMYEENRINLEDKDLFDLLCATIKLANESRTVIFRGSIIGDRNRMETYRVNLNIHEYTGDEPVVAGTWAIINPGSNDANSDYFEDSYIDALTGLLNKKAIISYAENAVSGINHDNVALAIMDIDNFKGVNDNYGHMFGDKVIKAVGEVIKSAVGTDAVAGRMGGDEFLIVFEKCQNELEYRNILRCIKSNVHAVYNGQMGDNTLSCSIGLARYGYGPGSTSYHDLFKIADRALYLAKQKGKDRYIIYKPEIHGDYSSKGDNGDIVNISNSYYSAAEIDKLHTLFTRIIVEGIDVIPETLDLFAKALKLDRVSVFYGEGNSPKFTSNYNGSVCPANPIVIKDEKYLGLFNNNMLAMSNVHAIEYSCPNVFNVLIDTEISSTMQYVLRDAGNNVAGLITADIFGIPIAFPKIVTNVYQNMCSIINAVLLREKLI